MKRILITAGIILIIVFAVIFGKKSLKKTNSPPIAVSTTVRTQEEIPINITLKGQDPEGLVISYKVLSQPSHGTLDGSEPNLIYTPDKDFNESVREYYCENMIPYNMCDPNYVASLTDAELRSIMKDVRERQCKTCEPYRKDSDVNKIEPFKNMKFEFNKLYILIFVLVSIIFFYYMWYR